MKALARPLKDFQAKDRRTFSSIFCVSVLGSQQNPDRPHERP